MLAADERTDVAAFSESLAEFTRAYRSVRGRFNSAAGRTDLSFSQYLLLKPLADAERPLCVGVLAESADVSAPSATRMVDGLEDRGLVVRLRDAEDRRHVRIELTADGRELVERKRERIAEAHTTIFDSLSAAERRAAAGLLSSLAEAMEELQP